MKKTLETLKSLLRLQWRNENGLASFSISYTVE